MTISYVCDLLEKDGYRMVKYDNELVDHWCGDINDAYREFAQGVLGRIPGSYFVVNASSKVLRVCVTGYPAVLGTIFMRCSARRNNYGATLYCVSSPHINNERGDRNVKSSTKVKVAIRNAAKCLTPMNYRKLLEDDALFQLYSTRHHVFGDVESAYRTTRNDAFGRNVPDYIIDELQRLDREGTIFQSHELRERLDAYNQAEALRQTKLDDKPPAITCVICQTNHKFEVNKLHIVPIKANNPDSLTTHWGTNKREPDTMAYIDNMPDYIAAGLNMLQMVGKEEYVEGIGMKVNDSVYFIEKRDA